MAKIESLIEELNALCKVYIEQVEDFKEQARLRELILQIEMQGYKIAFPGMDDDLPEIGLLTADGKKDFEKMQEIRRRKKEAVELREFERAADLRDEERRLVLKIQKEFCTGKEDQHFILAGKTLELILFNDPGHVLTTLIKSQDR